MFKLWGKIYTNNHMIRDITIAEDIDDTRTHKIFKALDEICHEFDLSRPVWLESNIRDFQRRKKVRFTKDNFVEEIDFDYLEIQIIEE
ncbi:MAG: hypothetical protein U0L49_03450 [Eubacterium sp.]|nr:hypothetical protein [Eubacterium sp.]